MDFKELEEKKNNIIKILEDKKISYILNDDIYSKIIQLSLDLEKDYQVFYSDAHKTYLNHTGKLKEDLENSSAWLLIVQLCKENKKIFNYFDIKYSIQNVISQISNLCNQNIHQELISDVANSGLCQICKKSIKELKNITNYNLKSARQELDTIIIEKMKDSTTREVLSSEIISKYDNNLNLNSNIYDTLLNFYKELTTIEKKQFLELLETFFSGGIMKIVEINKILNNLKTKSKKFQGTEKFINSLEEEIKIYQNSISKSGNIEWIFQL